MAEDINQIAKRVIEESTDVIEDSQHAQRRLKETERELSKKNPAAVALGRLGGQKGGKARAAALSAKRRKEIARKAAKSRWRKQ